MEIQNLTQKVQELIRTYYGISGELRDLPGEVDLNFILSGLNGAQFVVKLSPTLLGESTLCFQNKILNHLTKIQGVLTPKVQLTLSGQEYGKADLGEFGSFFIRILTYLPGRVFANSKPHSSSLLRDLGKLLAQVDLQLESFREVEGDRVSKWDLKNALWITDSLSVLEHHQQREQVEKWIALYREKVLPVLPNLRMSVIHGDANDYNILVNENEQGCLKVVGLIDFGDSIYTHTIYELAIAAAYASMDKPDPLQAAAHLISGYHEVLPLKGEELEVLFPLIMIRLCVSVVTSAIQKKRNPQNPHLTLSEAPAWALLEKLSAVQPDFAQALFRNACQFKNGWSPETLLKKRAQVIGKSVRTSYQKPLKIVRGWKQFVYDEEGRQYLDAINNVSHVGHCHPRVVKAGQDQMAILNTNTRYLHDSLVNYADRLCATLPSPLRVCYFVCSGSEANELALRLARNYTRRKGTLVVEGAYHGNTSSLIEISPYKFEGPGGEGRPDFVYKVLSPDTYRGPYKSGKSDQYAQNVAEELEKAKRGRTAGGGTEIGTWICESILSCGGQIVLPENYLSQVYSLIRAAGGVCIADEVQVGFGRVGSHFWGFETQGVVPDIVTFGKSMGNGHPLGAVVTRPEIADAFDNGMEYFNTFGGNPVSCAIGLAVLDVIQDEQLQENSRVTGEYLRKKLSQLAEKFPILGDVRGLGLFIGLELVLNRSTLEPATRQARTIVNRMRERGILLSTDGPYQNVIKIKPPLVFNQDDADFLVDHLGAVLAEDFAQTE